MKIAMTGASGLIGSAVSRMLRSAGHEVLPLVRRAPRPCEVRWDSAGDMDLSPLEGFDAVVHLAGENIAAGRWTQRRKASLMASRVEATRRLVVALLRLGCPPRAVVSASAIGWYETGRPETLDESAPPARTFLGRLVSEWEAQLEPARRAGVRTVALRFGVVLSPTGGALARMLPLFRLGLGGPLGHGRQPVSWVSLEDAARAAAFAVQSSIEGPVNVVAPHPLEQREFAAALGRALRRPAFLPTPAWVLRLAFGEMAESLLLSGARVAPARLLAAGFQFVHPDIESALRDLLRR